MAREGVYAEASVSKPESAWEIKCTIRGKQSLAKECMSATYQREATLPRPSSETLNSRLPACCPSAQFRARGSGGPRAACGGRESGSVDSFGGTPPARPASPRREDPGTASLPPRALMALWLPPSRSRRSRTP